ncbi:biotin--[acetyl-CoA-carboxylase] ligase [Helicobacter baculiformis]|uniref:Biotin--[acetyl-CoA-carboxylase] ligase n=1 Tax=Helicobacter baculiformis TaxID=427351 RepID=A0ABV7ZG06_9HELI|nr:biotin--[acetyl-CoA-carboxylase] ligase [Helicobacter baculiformis]
MPILSFACLPSTQLYLVEQVKQHALKLPVCVIAQTQNAGVGSRGCVWEQVEEGLTFSFAIALEDLPADVPRQSWSVYFGYLFKESLSNAQVWLKWPNDLYKGEEKIGGVMSQIVRDSIVCGIGLNLKAQHYGALGMLDKEALLQVFLTRVQAGISWQEVLKAYRLEFSARHQHCFFHDRGVRVPLRGARVLDDGGLQIGQQVYYGAR